MDLIKKQRNRYIILVILVFISMILSLYAEEIVRIIQYIIDPGFKDQLHFEFSSPFHFMWYVLTETYFNFDYSITFGTYLYQYFIPFFGSFSALYFYRRYHTIESFSFIRVKSYRKAVIKDAIRTSLYFASACFFGFFIFFILCLILRGDSFLEEISRPLFSDWLGPDFYKNFRWLYIPMEGLIRFLYIPFIYSIFGIGTVLAYRDNPFMTLTPLIYFYSLSIIGNSLMRANPFISIHIAPNALMALGDYQDVNSILILLINSIPLFIGMYFIWKETKYVNI